MYREVLLEPAVDERLYLRLQALELRQELGVIDVEVALAMVQNVVSLLAHGLDDRLVAHGDYFDALDPDVTDS